MYQRLIRVSRFSRKRLLCFSLPILGIIALVVSLVVVHVHEAKKLDSDKKTRIAGSPTKSLTTDRDKTLMSPSISTGTNDQTAYNIVNVILSWMPVEQDMGSITISGLTLSTITKTSHETVIAESTAVVHLTSTKRVLTTETQTDGSTVVKTQTSIVTTAIDIPDQVPTTSPRTSTATQDTSLAAGKPGPLPQNPSDGTQDITTTKKSEASPGTTVTPTQPEPISKTSPTHRSTTTNTSFNSQEVRTVGSKTVMVGPAAISTSPSNHTPQTSSRNLTTHRSPTHSFSHLKAANSTSTARPDSDSDFKQTSKTSTISTTDTDQQATTTSDSTQSPISNFQTRSDSLLATL